MSTSFKVLPQPYTGVVGSTMPVRAELQGGEIGGCPIGETYYLVNASNQISEAEKDVQFGSTVVLNDGYKLTEGSSSFGITVNGLSLKPLDGLTATLITEKPIGCIIQTVTYSSGFIGVTVVQGSSVSSIRILCGMNPESRSPVLSQIDENVPYDIECVLSMEAELRGDSMRYGTITVRANGAEYSAEVKTSPTEETGNVTIGTSAGGQLPVLTHNYWVGQGFPNQCTGEVETYNVELFDKDGVSRDVQTVTGGEISGCPIGESFEKSTGEITVGDEYAFSVPQSEFTLSFDTRLPVTTGFVIPLEVKDSGGKKFLSFALRSSGTEVRISYGIYGDYTELDIPNNNSVYSCTITRTIGVGYDLLILVGDVAIVNVTGLEWDDGESGELVSFNSQYSPPSATVLSYTLVGQNLPNQCTGEVVSKAEYIYDVPNMQSSDTGEWRLVADGAVEAPFDVAIIAEGANTVSQGDISVEVLTLEGNGVDITLDMGRGVDSRGFVQWLDNGKEYDRYKNSLTIRTDSPSQFETLMNSDSVDTLIITTPIKDAYFPFGMGFATQQNYPVNVNTWDIDEETYFGEVKEYSLTTFPNVRDIYSSLVESTTLSGCVLDHWQIAGIPFPYTRPKNEHNDMRFVSVGHGDSYQVVDPTRPYGEVAECSIEVEEEQARQILQFFTKVMRGTEQTATFPSSYNLFSRRYEGLTTATVKLFSNVVNVIHVSQGRVEINFSLQIVGV